VEKAHFGRAQVLDSGGTDVLGFIKKVSQRPFKLEEAKQAKEAFMVGSSTVVRNLHLLLFVAFFAVPL
jgi:hypothetical protein